MADKPISDPLCRNIGNISSPSRFFFQLLLLYLLIISDKPQTRMLRDIFRIIMFPVNWKPTNETTAHHDVSGKFMKQRVK